MKVIFHTGLVKTGSTFIQELIRQNEPMLGATLGLAIKDKRAEHLREAGKAYGRRPKPRRMRGLREKAAQFFESVREDRKPVTLYSDETLMGAAPYGPSGHVFEWGNAILGGIEAERGDIDVEFVLYYRPFEDWERSAHNQLVKHDGLTVAFPQWRDAQPYPREWKANFETLAAGLQSPISFVDMDEDIKSGILGRALLRKSGLTDTRIDALQRPPPQNVSLNSGGLAFMLEVNSLGLPQSRRRRISDIVAARPELFVTEVPKSVRPVSAPPPPAEQSTSSGFSSEAYWKRRYVLGRNSGAGSYGRLAEYKAEHINRTVSRRRIKSVIEYGSGDGNQASLFTFPNYTGIDVAPTAVETCRARFADRPGWSFHLADAVPERRFDLAMSLDVIYHLIEDEVYERYMTQLFDSAGRYVLIYASDFDAPGPARHVRHRAFSDWVARNRPRWKLVDAPEHPYPMTDDSDSSETSFAAFKLFRAPA